MLSDELQATPRFVPQRFSRLRYPLLICDRSNGTSIRARKKLDSELASKFQASHEILFPFGSTSNIHDQSLETLLGFDIQYLRRSINCTRKK